nr:ABC transporter ATP-binding protein/permease [uncultured Treponema sp.]
MMIDKRLVNLVPEAKKYVFYTVVLQILGLVSNTVFIFFTADALRKIKNNDTISLSIAVMITCLIVSILVNILASRTTFRTSSKVKITLRTKLYQKLLSLGTAYREKSATAKIMQVITEGVDQIETWFGAFLPQFYYSMIAAVFTFCIIAFFNLKMAVVLLICIPLIPVSMVIVQGIAKKILGKYWVQYANLADNFLENLEGLTTLKIFEADEFKAKQMAGEAETFRRVTMKVLSMQLNSIIIMDTVAYSGAALGIVFALKAFYAGSLDFYSAFICILLSADFFIPLRRLGSAFHTAMNGVTASKNIFEILDAEEKKYGNKKISAQSKPLLIESENLGITFDRPALKNCSIKIRKGSFTSFIGQSGSGKSSLAKIISGIYGNYTGSIKINGTEIKEISRTELYNFVTYISHLDWIFAGTIRDCLLEGDPKATERKMQDVLKKTGLWEFIKDNGGLYMKLREGGTNLSGGQKQRLSIARALLHESEVYIFDEATSNIDVESEKIILDLIHSLKGKKTVIMISHRKENSKGADSVYNFEDGTIKTSRKTTSLRTAGTSRIKNRRTGGTK